MELCQLRYFLTIAQEGAYGRAAQVLHIAQPALSRQIQKLEEELGAQLFVRHPHGVTMTPAAMSIKARAAHILEEVNAVAHVTRAREPMAGSIKIGVSPGTAEIIAFPLSRLVAKRFPDFRCELVSMLMPARAQLLKAGDVAFALMNAPHSRAGLTTIPLLREPLCLLFRADDDRFTGDIIDLRDLADVPLVLNGSAKAGIRTIIGSAFASAGITLRVAAEVNTAGACKALVLEGVGPTVHVAAMAGRELLRGELRAILIRGMFSTRVLAISDDRPLTPQIREMMDTVRDCLGELIASGKWLNGELIYH